MLTQTHCKNAVCPGGKLRVRLADSGGLYLEVVPSGSKRWFWKYCFSGKEKRLALGSYPDVGLKEARVVHENARKQEQRGVDRLLSALNLSQIGAPTLPQSLCRVENCGVRELPHSALEACGHVFRCGVSTDRCERNPAADL